MKLTFLISGIIVWATSFTVNNALKNTMAFAKPVSSVGEVSDLFRTESTEDAKQLAKVCQSLAEQHPIKRTFCNQQNRPVLPTSLSMMVERLGLQPAKQGSMPKISMALAAKSSPSLSSGSLFPQEILFQSKYGDPVSVSMKFVRGEQFVKIMVASNSQHPQTEAFLVSFRQPCNDSDIGCTTGDLLTAALEDNWISITVFRAKNTARLGYKRL